MKLELVIFGITGFLIANTYYDGKYIKIMQSWKKYYQMTFFGFLVTNCQKTIIHAFSERQKCGYPWQLCMLFGKFLYYPAAAKI